MAEHDYDVRYECGARWRVRLEADDDAMATCLACGVDTFNLTDIGRCILPAAMWSGTSRKVQA